MNLIACMFILTHLRCYLLHTDESVSLQCFLWLCLWWNPNHSMLVVSKLFIAGLSFFTALGFLLYGGRLFLMLKYFPLESKGRQQKLREVGRVASICFCCFLARCIMMCFNAFNKEADLDVLDHPVLNFFYYLSGNSKLLLRREAMTLVLQTLGLQGAGVELELQGHHQLNHPMLVQVTLEEKDHQLGEEEEEEEVLQGLLHTSMLRLALSFVLNVI